MQVTLVAALLVAAGAQPPKPGPGFRNFVNSLSKVVAAEGEQFFKAPPATVETGMTQVHVSTLMSMRAQPLGGP